MGNKRSKPSLPVEQTPVRKNMQQSAAPLPSGYGPFLEDLKARIRTAQVKASLAANRELIELYWHIGRSIVERLSADLQREFLAVAGFSVGNIWRMRAFHLAWTEEVLAQSARDSGKTKLAQAARELDGRNLPRAAAEIPWGHNIQLITKNLKELGYGV